MTVEDPGSVDLLTLEDLLEVASAVLGRPLVHDVGLLASAVARPRTSAFGDDAHPDFADKAAALMHSLARNHALVDGNERLAWAATRTFCLINSRDLTMSVDAAEALVVGVAAGDFDVASLAGVLAAHLQ